MYGRITEIEGSPERIDEATRHLTEVTIPRFRDLPGAKGFIAFADREGGRMIGISLWESQEAMAGARDQAQQLRTQSAEEAGGQIVNVTECEVVFDERF